MSRAAFVTALVLAAAGTGFAAGSTGSELGQQARLRILDPTPLTVHGVGFVAHEHVTVTYVATRTWTRRTDASTAGSFTVRFAGVHFDVCSARSLRAVGSRGSKAFVKIPPAQCPPPAPEG